MYELEVIPKRDFEIEKKNPPIKVYDKVCLILELVQVDYRVICNMALVLLYMIATFLVANH